MTILERAFQNAQSADLGRKDDLETRTQLLGFVNERFLTIKRWEVHEAARLINAAKWLGFPERAEEMLGEFRDFINE